MLSTNNGHDRKPLLWFLAFSVAATFTVGLATLLSGALDPSPGMPASPPAALPDVAVTPTPPPVPTATPGPENPADTAAPDRPLLMANGRRQPLRVKVPPAARGRYAVAPGVAQPPRSRKKGKVIRYIVEVERGLPFDVAEFADEVHRILNDPRGWGFRFKRVSRGPVKIRVSLSSPAMTDRRCLPMQTVGVLSCWNGGRAVINAMRWNSGTEGYGRDVASYREYVINHEVGHGLGHGHVSCPGPGRRAPVMLQQTKSLYGCRPNPWPFPRAGAPARDDTARRNASR
ncbi:hypothetical protein FHS43_004990 [Streptosporangium becharense]|uniref:DUF3152 domain-containing protein n=1 Tax=Streptosporangium becharense TaxID=1816182 RepID=A0A7W9IBN6_9ACTN|nr:DUF3152 domain-containing protein [Streptosporangium becharense]MBB2913681.1 hypothetical protein [Streptosporangium becharense]MBB5817762.1 hypothetical protein [Streptosporangium becharense]